MCESNLSICTLPAAEDVETVSSYMKSRCVRSVVEEDPELTQPTQEVGFICHQFSSELKRKIKVLFVSFLSKQSSLA